ncbi:MAG TPA: hypothetical protein VIC87_15405, partial [Vicinamibacteria bacterium]
MAALPLLLTLLAVAAWARLLDSEGESSSRFHRIAEAISVHVVVSVIVAVALVACGSFRPLSAAALAGALPVLAVFLARPGRGATAPRALATPLEARAAVLVVLFLPFTWPNLEPLRMVRDAGVYSTRAVHHLHEGELTGRIAVRDRLRGELLAVFDRDNMLESSEATTDDEVGAYLPGTYVSPRDRSRFSFQFLPGWPMALALWAGHFGLEHLYGVQPVLYALSIVLFALVVQRHARGMRTPLAATLLFASSPLLLFFSRYPTSELLLLFAFLFVVHFAAERSWRAPVLGSAGVALLALSHSSTFLYAPLLLLAAVGAGRPHRRSLAHFAAISFGSLLVLLPVTFLVSPDYMRYVYAYSFAFLPVRDPMRAGVASVAAFYLVSLGLSLRALRSTGGEARPGNAGLRGLLSAATPGFLLLVALWTLGSAYRLGWTDLFLRSPNVGAWARRAAYANAGLS